MSLRKLINAAKKGQLAETVTALEAQKAALAMQRAARREKLKDARCAKKEPLKKIASDLGKKRTRIKNLAAKCEGMALINYKSNAQLLVELRKMKGLKSLKKLNDDTLSIYAPSHPVVALIQKYHTLSKEIGTYGDQWATEWITKPCKEEGWLHPGDGRLHSVFNQFHAETGRSSSEKPNGQNLPQDFDVRSCFLADPPDEEEPEGYVLVTADMSGAELRIIAELAKDPIWIGCFKRGEDVHSVGTEMLRAAAWAKERFYGGEIYYEKQQDGTEKEKIGVPCAYYALNVETGQPAKVKCKCPGHNKLRNATKAVNFLLAYGGGPTTLAAALGITADEAKELMALHEAAFPLIWAYLKKSGDSAKLLKKSFDLFGGRRLFPKPNRDLAVARCIEKDKEKGEDGKFWLKDWQQAKNIAAWSAEHGGEAPKGDNLYNLTHRHPTEKEITNSYMALHGNIERQGKNHAIQGSNARIAKIAMGCGFDPNGQPYLWHTLGQYKAKLIKFIHDELVVQCPRRFGPQVAALIKDAYKRAAAERMSLVEMESDANIEVYWSK
jgi:DNA polymerase I-like protein with 3'-5' exonuclease and polymerase domains